MGPLQDYCDYYLEQIDLVDVHYKKQIDKIKKEIIDLEKQVCARMRALDMDPPPLTVFLAALDDRRHSEIN